METGKGGGFYFQTIDNQQRREDLAIVERAEDADALLVVCREHFDTTISSLTAERVLQEFSDERLDPTLAATEGFDPTLYKAVVLFELTHLSEDESSIPFMLEDLVKFWTNQHGTTREEYDRWITAETKKSYYRPFTATAEHVIHGLMNYSINQWKESFKREPCDTKPEADPLETAIDGEKKEWRVFMGGHELPKADEHPVLTRQLRSDLRKIYPDSIVKELDFRFPDEGKFEDIQPTIDTIIYERQQGILPPAEEIVSGYMRHQRHMQAMFGRHEWDSDENDTEAQLKDAIKYLKEHHRKIGNRINQRELYVLKLGRWVVINHLESDTERDVSYRRIFYGDMGMRKNDGLEEVPIEDRGPINEELDIERDKVESSDGGSTSYRYWSNPDLIDVFGPFENVVTVHKYEGVAEGEKEDNHE